MDFRRERLEVARKTDSPFDRCYVCGGESDVYHHLSYFPEKTIRVCHSCHNEIHGNSYDWLEPEESRPDNYTQIRNKQYRAESSGEANNATHCDECLETRPEGDLWLQYPGDDGTVNSKKVRSSKRLSDESDHRVVCFRCLGGTTA